MKIKRAMNQIARALTNGISRNMTLKPRQSSVQGIVYADHDYVEWLRLLNNKKVVTAGLAAALTFSIGIMSTVNYMMGPSVYTSPVAEVNLEEPVASDLDLEVVDPVQTTIETTVSNQTKDQVPLDLAVVSSQLNLPNPFMIYESCFVLRVDGQVLGYFKDQSSAQGILDRLIEAEVADDAELLEVGFAENVTLALEEVSIYDLNAYAVPETVEELIHIGTNEKRIYKVQKGDSFWTISQKHGMTEGELVAANPDAAKQKYLQLDQELSLIVPVPLINVMTKQRVTVTESIGYDTVYENNSSIYVGEESIKVRGVSGKKEIVKDIVKISGQIQPELEQVVSENIVSEPTTRVMYKGTKPAPPKIGTGTFAKPLSRSYTVTSPFGKRWGTLHTGIDLALPTGSSVLAADGGKVIFSGNNGTYGLLVIIDHGANLSSYYAHNSKLLVQKGDQVFKGQKIALSGNTGRSTGPHLHFEVRKNGRPVNPTQYLNF